MSVKGPLIPANAQIGDEAAEWFVQFTSGELDPEARRRFDAWLRASPAHIQAYFESLQVWQDGALLPRDEQETPRQLIESALRADNVRSLEPRHAPVIPARAPARWWQGSARIAVAATVLLMCAGVLAWVSMQGARGYVTGIGEERLIVLTDGSTVDMNSASKIRVQFDQSRREVHLLEGQALFRVAKDAVRPFVVHSGATQVRAVGTQFDVNRHSSATTVSVIEGKVAVLLEEAVITADEEPGAPALKPQQSASPRVQRRPILVAAGEQVVVSGSSATLPVRADVAAAAAWAQRRLVFESTPLEQVVEDFNRYNSRRLRIRDPELQSFLISGAFSSNSPASLVRFLEEQPGVAVSESKDEFLIMRK